MQRDLANGEEELVEGSPYLEVPVIEERRFRCNLF